MTNGLFAGISTIDVAYLVDSYPAEDTKNKARDQFMGAGGPAANAAVAYAFLSSKHPRLVTALGSHRLTEIARTDLHRHGVQTVDLIANEPQELPVSSIVVARDRSSRTIVSLDASRMSVQPTRDHIVMEFTEDVGIVLTDGHYTELSLTVAQEARRRGVPVVFDGGRWRDTHKELLPFVDIAICSAAFAPPGTETDDDGAVFDYIQNLGPQMAAITNGPEPIRFSSAGTRGSISVRQGPVVDTLGAGDILHGAFCYFFANAGLEFDSALTMAASVASESCQHFGTREWMRHASIGGDET